MAVGEHDLNKYRFNVQSVSELQLYSQSTDDHHIEKFDLLCRGYFNYFQIMENVFEAGKMPYVAAPPLVPLTFGQSVAFAWHVVWDVIGVLVYSLPYWLESFVFLFFNRPKKSIKGQVALVSDCLFLNM